MVKPSFRELSEKDRQLVLETEPKKLQKLDEDQLIDLHTRVRRARTRHSKNYRRGAGAQVSTDRARAAASKKNQRSAARAEVFEDALARVSRRLGAVARASADELRAERMALVKAAKGGSKGSPSRSGKGSRKPKGSGSSKAKRRTPATERSRAQAKSSGKRRQAKRDAR